MSTTNLLIELYLWLQGFHILAVLLWVGPMVVLPVVLLRQLNLPGDAAALQPVADFLLKRLMNPAMIAAWLFGLAMLAANWQAILIGAGWMHAKLLLVVVLTVLHALLARWRRKIAAGQPVGAAVFPALGWATAIIAGLAAILAQVEPF